MIKMRTLLGFLPSILLVVSNFGFTSCGGGDDNGIETPKPNEPVETKYSPVGVWENGEYFISFNEDKFCCAYFVGNYVDCGSYSINDNTVICNNAYYAKQTKYNIIKLTENTMEVNIEYTSVKGEAQTKTMTFTKSKDKVAATKDHSLVGKSMTSLVYFGGSTNYSTWSFETYNTGTHSMKSGSAAKYPLKVYYVFFDSKIYFQTFKTTEQMPSIGGWNPSTDVTISKISFGEDGSLAGITKIN